MEDESIIKNIASRLDKTPSTEDFDKKKEFDEFIWPKLFELKCLCNEHRIPFFFTACVGNAKDKSTYKSTMISPFEFPTRLNLYDDKISKCLGIMIGFDSVYPKKDVEVDMNKLINDQRDEFLQRLEKELFVEKTYMSKTSKENNIRIVPEDISNVHIVKKDSSKLDVSDIQEIEKIKKDRKPRRTPSVDSDNPNSAPRKRGRPQKDTARNSHVEEVVIQLIKSGKATTVKDILENSNIEDKELKSVLVKLKKQNIINRIGAKKNGYWQFVGNTEEVAPSLDPIEEKLLALIKSEEAKTVKDFLYVTSFDQKEITKALKLLKDSNKIRRVGAKKNGYWEII